MTAPLDDRELLALVDALCEETITGEQMQRLEEMVLTDPQAAALYVQYMRFFADLECHFSRRPVALGNGRSSEK
jgi:hypothetical protein